MADDAGGVHQGSPFVGRARERGLLSRGLDELAAGRGSLILIEGEPGIGKTRLAAELARDAAARGIRSLWGHSIDWDGTPPYWPWIEVIRDLFDSRNWTELTERLVAEAPDAVNSIPELAALTSQPPTSELTMSAERARFRLLDGLTRFVHSASSTEPLLILLEDLHWADPASLLLLEFAARDLDRHPVLILGTLRNAADAETPQLRATLAALSRTRAVHRIVLSALDRGDVRKLASEIMGESPAQTLVDAVFDRSDGNPFFATEILRHAIDRDLKLDSSTDSGSEIGVPASVRDVIAQRLSRLDDNCQRLLAIASVLGREFSLGMLEEMTGMTAGQLLTMLDEATAARLVERGDPARPPRFTHAMIQEVLYERLTQSELFDFHAQAGVAIERLYADRLSSYYGELARHFRESPHGKNLEKAIEYSELAGDQAIEQLAWESASGHYDRAIHLLGIMNTRETPERECELLLKLGEAQQSGGVSRGLALGAGNDPVSRATFQRAAEVAARAGLFEVRARAALGASGINPQVAIGLEQVTLMNDALKTLPDEDSDVRARLLARLARDAFLVSMKGHRNFGNISLRDQPFCWSRQAIEMARRLGSPTTLAYCLLLRPMVFAGPLSNIDEHLRLAGEIISSARAGHSVNLLVWGLAQRHYLLLQRGDVHEALRLLDEILPLIDSLKLPVLDWAAALNAADQQIRTGQYGAALRSLERAESHWPNSLVANLQRFIIYREQGRSPDDTMDRLRAGLRTGDVAPLILLPYELLYLLELGKTDDAVARIQSESVPELLKLPATSSWIRLLTLLAEACYGAGETTRAAQVLEALAPYVAQNIGDGHHDHTGGSVAYYLGLLAVTLERWTEAEQHFSTALELNERWGYRPYVAYTHFAWADMLLRRGDPANRDQAMQMLAEASGAAAEIGMVRLKRLNDAARKRHRVPQTSPSSGLSRREFDVLRLLVEGKSDREIGEELFISHHTVMRHVSSILRKLDVESRSAAAVYAVRNDVV